AQSALPFAASLRAKFALRRDIPASSPRPRSSSLLPEIPRLPQSARSPRPTHSVAQGSPALYAIAAGLRLFWIAPEYPLAIRSPPDGPKLSGSRPPGCVPRFSLHIEESLSCVPALIFLA